MRSTRFTHLLLATFTILGISQAAAQENEPARRAWSVVAMDEPSADLVHRLFPQAKVSVVVRSDDESYSAINGRAIMLRDASHVFYRGDQSSLVSQFFRERLCAQGMRGIDISSRARSRDSDSSVEFGANPFHMALSFR